MVLSSIYYFDHLFIIYHISYGYKIVIMVKEIWLQI
jgi:hypothetical protein